MTENLNLESDNYPLKLITGVHRLHEQQYFDEIYLELSGEK